ncbi:MAG: 3-isopropylmalate dehydratase large subunit [Thermoplasmatota archaeon]
MGKTVLEKIFERHSDTAAEPGDVIWLEVDLRTARDFGGANVVKHLQRHYDSDYVDDPEKTAFTFDCNAPAKTPEYADNQHICRRFARENGVPVYDVDQGIGTHVMLEQGRILPGVTAVGTDSHYNIVGAVGAFGQGMGDMDIAFTFKTGRTWFEVPESMKITFTGMPDGEWTAKDLTLKVLSEIGSTGALGKAVEFEGDVIDELSLAGRITLSSMLTEMGGIIGFIPPSKEVLAFCRERSGSEVQPVYADDDATYEEEIGIDVSDLEPLVAAPYSPANVKSVASLSDVAIDTVFIGSCTNGRLEDMQAAADVLRGNHIADGVTAKIVPATREVWDEMLQSGVLRDLHEAGALISNPGCGGCASGQIGMTGRYEVQVSTSNRNFKGKQGPGETYLASPVTAARAALTGYIGGGT